MSNEQLEQAMRDAELDVAAGTAWLWARTGLAARRPPPPTTPVCVISR